MYFVANQNRTCLDGHLSRTCPVFFFVLFLRFLPWQCVVIRVEQSEHRFTNRDSISVGRALPYGNWAMGLGLLLTIEDALLDELVEFVFAVGELDFEDGAVDGNVAVQCRPLLLPLDPVFLCRDDALVAVGRGAL